MGFKFPYGNEQQLNLNWFIKKFKELLADWQHERESIDGALDAEIQRAEDALSDVYTARDVTVAAKNDALQAKADALTAAANAAQYWQNAAASANSAATSALTALQAAQDASNDAAQTSSDRTGVAADKAAVAADKAAVAADKATVAADKAAVAQDKDDVDTLKDAANAAALRSEGWADGTQNGTPVTSGSPYYENNAKYYKDAAQAVYNSIPQDYSDLSAEVDEHDDKITTIESAFPTNEITGYKATFNAFNFSTPLKTIITIPYIGTTPITQMRIRLHNKNLIDLNERLPQTSLDSSGNEISSSAGVYTTAFIDVTGMTNIYLSYLAHGSSSFRARFYGYDANKNPVRQLWNAGSLLFNANIAVDLTQYPTIKYVRFAYRPWTNDYYKSFACISSEKQEHLLDITDNAFYGGTIDLNTGETISLYDQNGDLLATPNVTQVTAINLTPYDGENNYCQNVNSDAYNNVEYCTITYRQNIENAETNLISFITGITCIRLNNMIADRNLVVNEFRIVGSALYRITAPVAAGATLTVNTNCVKTTIAEELTRILNS